MNTQNETAAFFLAKQFLTAYYEAERTGEQIEEIARLDVLADVARKVMDDEMRNLAAKDLDLANEEKRAAAKLLAPMWRIPADAHTTCEFARMVQMEITNAGIPTPTTADVCDYVTTAVHAFEAEYRATNWGDELDWCEETEKFLNRYMVTVRPPWDTDDARREREAEDMRRELRASGYLVTGMDGRVEIRERASARIVLMMECQGDGTCDVENHDANRVEKAVQIDTMLTYARLMVRA